VRTTAAVQIDNRRFNTSEAKENYVKSICRGQKPASLETSQVPVLGRGLEEDVCLELDISTLETDERLKAERMLGQPVAPKLKKEVKSGSKRPISDASPAGASTKQVEKQSLGDLIKAATARKMARRGDLAHEAEKRLRSAAAVAAISTKAQMETRPAADGDLDAAPRLEAVAEPTDQAASAPVAMDESRAIEEGAAPSSGAQEQAENGETLDETSPQVEPSSEQPSAPAAGAPVQSDAAAPLDKDLAAELSAELVLAGKDNNKIKKLLRAVGGIPANDLNTVSAHNLYSDIGRLIQGSEREDVKQLALRVRRTLRLATSVPKKASADGGA